MLEKEERPVSTQARFSRIELLLGSEKVDLLLNSFVTVVGLGAVGSYAVEALARAGIGRLRLVDFDTIIESNINRQLFALDSTLGREKAAVAAERVFDINPRCRVEALPLFFSEETANEILGDRPHFVIDAIDSLNPKAALVQEVLRRKLPFISVMGAARRLNPEAVTIGPLSDARGCPLARLMRKRLRKRGCPLNFPCVYSREFDDKQSLGGPVLDKEEYFSRGRARRPMGSLPTLTGIFGLLAANYAIKYCSRI